MKSKFKKEDVIDCLKDEIPEGWELFLVYPNKNVWSDGVKIRKKYDDNEIHFNEDGYKYDIIWLNLEFTKHYKFMLSKGYKV